MDLGDPLFNEAAKHSTTIVDMMQYALEHYEVQASSVDDVSSSLTASNRVEIGFFCDYNIIMIAGTNKEGKFIANLYNYTDHYPLELARLFTGVYDELSKLATKDETFTISIVLRDQSFGAEDSESAAALLNVLNEYYASLSSVK